MFRQADTFAGGWRDKTIEAMQQRRFENRIRQLPNLGTERLQNLSLCALRRRIEHCWLDIERKPVRKQQETAVKAAIQSAAALQADCLSRDEHDLVERALILGGCVQINDMPELEAAMALTMRLWGNVGLVSGKPYLELEPMICQLAAKAFASTEHEALRGRFDAFHGYMTSLLYRAGAVDDRLPQQMILREVFGCKSNDTTRQLARWYLWASYDCVDYSDGVMLVHSGLAQPEQIAFDIRRKTSLFVSQRSMPLALDILPEEIPLQIGLEQAIASALREKLSAHDVARNVRLLCKQGAPLCAMEDVLQASLIVHLTPAMRAALRKMYYTMPKWTESRETAALQ